MTAWQRFAESKLVFPLIVLAVILLFDLIFDPGFFALTVIDGHLFGNVVDILRNGSTVMLLAIGMTLVIATGGVDLSVGAVMAISASIAALLIDPNYKALTHDPNFSAVPLPLVFVITLAVGGPVRAVERAAGGLRQHPADGRDADPDDRRPRHRPADHRRRPDPDLLRAVRVPRQRLGRPAGLPVRRRDRVRRGLAPDPQDVARHVHRVGRDQRADRASTAASTRSA